MLSLRFRYTPLPRLGLLVLLALTLRPLSSARAEGPAASATASTAPVAPSSVLDVSAVERARDRLVGVVGKHGGTVGIAVTDLNGQLLVGHQPDRPLNPASNMKVVTAFAALKRLGPQHRYLTALYGRLGRRMPTLSLRGDGDPSLERRHLWEMVERLHRAGLREVGDVIVDQSAFAPPETPPAFDAQPHEWAAFRAPVSAVALAGNTITIEVRPGLEGQPARVSVVPAGVARLEGRVKTSPGDKPDAVGLEMKLDGEHLVARVSGTIPTGGRTVRVTRRVDDPRRLAGAALVAICRQIGIEVTGEVKVGAAAGKLVSAHRSAPLSALLLPLGKKSNNFFAETIFKSISGSEGKTPASHPRSVALVVETLDEAGLPLTGVEIRNGSGLFEGGRLTARMLAQLLAQAHGDPAVGPELRAQLSIAGVDGTLRARLRRHAKARAVRAKTGTLAAVSAMSGYATLKGGKTVAFSLLVNDVRGKAVAVRKDLDAFVDALIRAGR